jgi:hypothetical protein
MKTLKDLKDHLDALEKEYGLEFLSERLIILEDRCGREAFICSFNNQYLEIKDSELNTEDNCLDW